MTATPLTATPSEHPELTPAEVGRLAADLLAPVRPPDPKPVRRITMSALGECPRRAAYRLAGTPHTDPDGTHPAATLGTWVHDGLLPRLALHYRAAGLEAHHERRVAWRPFHGSPHATPGMRRMVVQGRLDLVVGDTLVDVKTVGEHGMDRRLRAGLSNGDRMQTVGYAAARGQRGVTIRRRLVLLVDRASGDTDVLEEAHTYDDEEQVRAWLEDVLEGAKDPDSVPRGERGPGLSIVCDGCPMLRRCWGEDAVPGQTGPQGDLLWQTGDLDLEEAANAARIHATSHGILKAATDDKAWASALLRRVPTGVYGEHKVKQVAPKAPEEVDVPEALRLLEEVGIPVPKRTGHRSGYVLVTRAPANKGGTRPTT